jgi:hypothetical protein
MQQLRSAAIATMAAKARRVPERPPFECIALLLQGGGALNMQDFSKLLGCDFIRPH